ncbi:nucleotidyltransferase domain-containing protein [Methanoregula sp.]|uniref:nucleotidyltransferase domain-containing protein n=1 Tax=Methanoregula sp. TaxID=2052170 RepID=UPI002632D9F0|nr:nucleotidyltransferase domain-containing protein [Methanoregula sp.]MDD5142464.1 nucleotidyltransferase domain-containing protein [Methanoregula sp.]
MTKARQAKKNPGKRKTSGIDGDLETITAAVLPRIEGVEAIYLFGSLARGDADTGSDYDIVAVVDSLPEAYTESVAAVRHALLGKTSRSVDLIILDHDDLKSDSPILYEISKHHRLIHGRDVLSRAVPGGRKVRPIVMDGATIGYHV